MESKIPYLMEFLSNTAGALGTADVLGSYALFLDPRHLVGPGKI